MKTLLATALCLGLTACASPGVEQYKAETPVLDLRTYLNGTVDGWGMFQGRSGEVKKRFHVVIDARWEGDTGVLDETAGFLEGRLVSPGTDSYYDLPSVSAEVADLYQHCVRAIGHGLRFGAHGLPLMGSGDWNDGMNMIGKDGLLAAIVFG